MPLEFALRPRFDLERPAPRRRWPRWLRLPPLALPVVAYWLAIAGATHALIGLATAEPSSGTEVEERSPPIERELEYLPPPRAEPPPQPTAEPAVEPEVVAAPEPEPPRERAVEPERRIETPVLQRELVQREDPPPVTRSEPPAIPHGEPPAITRSEPPAPKRAALDELWERSEEPPRESPKEVVREEPSRGERAGSLPSCESAAASANETIDLRGGARRAPDLTRDAFAAVLENGAYLNRCSIPARTALEICAAVQDGKVVGVTVTTAPRDSAVAACVRRAVSTLRFPRSERLDVTRTRFEPAR